MPSLIPYIKFRATTDNGDPLSNGKVFTYEAGTLNPVVTFKNFGGTPNTNPIVLDERGEADIWLADGQRYKFIVTDSMNNQVYDPVDDVSTSVSENEGKVFVTASDASSGFLQDKIEAGDNINLVVNTDGSGNQTLEISATGTSTTIGSTVNQTAHGFSVNNVIRFNGTDWVLALANNVATLGTHMVSAVNNPNQFEFVLVGSYTSVSHGLTVGEFYYLSDTVAGALVTVEPAISNPMIFVETANNIRALNYRPSAIAVDAISKDYAVRDEENTFTENNNFTGGLQKDGVNVPNVQSFTEGQTALFDANGNLVGGSVDITKMDYQGDYIGGDGYDEGAIFILKDGVDETGTYTPNVGSTPFNGKAFSFAFGGADSVDTGVPASVLNGAEYSIGFWFQTDSGSVSQDLELKTGGITPNNFNLQIDIQSDQINLYTGTGSQQAVVNDSSITDDTFHSVVLVKSGGQLKTYYDGVESATVLNSFGTYGATTLEYTSNNKTNDHFGLTIWDTAINPTLFHEAGFTGGTVYNDQDVVTDNNATWVSLKDFNAETPSDSAVNWDKVGDTNATKTISFTEGNLYEADANGNLVDTGKKVEDFSELAEENTFTEFNYFEKGLTQEDLTLEDTFVGSLNETNFVAYAQSPYTGTRFLGVRVNPESTSFNVYRKAIGEATWTAVAFTIPVVQRSLTSIVPIDENDVIITTGFTQTYIIRSTDDGQSFAFDYSLGAGFNSFLAGIQLRQNNRVLLCLGTGSNDGDFAWSEGQDKFASGTTTVVSLGAQFERATAVDEAPSGEVVFGTGTGSGDAYLVYFNSGDDFSTAIPKQIDSSYSSVVNVQCYEEAWFARCSGGPERTIFFTTDKGDNFTALVVPDGFQGLGTLMSSTGRLYVGLIDDGATSGYFTYSDKATKENIENNTLDFITPIQLPDISLIGLDIFEDFETGEIVIISGNSSTGGKATAYTYDPDQGTIREDGFTGGKKIRSATQIEEQGVRLEHKYARRDTDATFAGFVATDDVFTITRAQASGGVPNNSFFRDSGRSNKLSYKGIAGVVTTIEP